MSMNSLINDYVARINNARMLGKQDLVVLKNKLTVAVSKKLVSLKYLTGFVENKDMKTLTLTLDLNKLHSIKAVSTPGQRVYAQSNKAPKIVGGKGYTLYTTSKGVLSHVEAKKQNVGGEVLLQIY